MKLVVTVALKKELPLLELRKKYTILTTEALKSGIGIPNRSIIFIITGVGAEKSKEACRVIEERINPDLVLNIGTAGSHVFNIGDVIAPEEIIHQNKNLPLCQFLNYPKFVKKKGKLSSTKADYDLIDMESEEQAIFFSKIPFACVKIISDQNNHQTPKVFAKQLPYIQKTMGILIDALFKTVDSSQITVIIPTFNRKNWIEKSLQSVLCQTVKPREIIIVDDGSDDGTNNILTHYPQVTLIQHSKNKGVSQARNTGVANSKTDWIAFLDSDDEWKKDKLEKQIDYQNAYPFFSILQSEEAWIKHGKPFKKQDYHHKKEGFIFTQSLDRCMVTNSSVLLKKELFIEFGGFDPNLRLCEDYDLWLKISRSFPIGLCPHEGLIRYAGHEQLSATPALDQYRLKTLSFLYKPEKNEELKRLIQQCFEKKFDIYQKGAKKRGIVISQSDFEYSVPVSE